jgi:ABC-type polysaccharide/polyol phosphate transport system ATPase subunit
MTKITAKNLSVFYPVMNADNKTLGNLKVINNSTGWGNIVGGRRPHVVAIDDISISLKAGERVALMGKNGSGKTTLLRTIGGIIIPNQGQLDIDGKASGIFNLKQGLKMECSGRRNIILRGLALGKRVSEIRDKQHEIETFSELGEYLELPISTYSSGMVMRLIFSVVIAFDPDIMLLDEWIGTADESFRQRATKRLQNYTLQDRVFMLASHSPRLLKETCETGLLMKSGKIIDYGPLNSVLKQYKALNSYAT